VSPRPRHPTLAGPGHHASPGPLVQSHSLGEHRRRSDRVAGISSTRLQRARCPLGLLDLLQRSLSRVPAALVSNTCKLGSSHCPRNPRSRNEGRTIGCPVICGSKSVDRSAGSAAPVDRRRDRAVVGACTVGTRGNGPTWVGPARATAAVASSHRRQRIYADGNTTKGVVGGLW